MIKKLQLALIAALASIVVLGCQNPVNKSVDAGDSVINLSVISGVTAPVLGATPVTTITETAQFTGTIAWSGTPETFAPTTVYTATITLTAKDGYTFTGVTADFFTVTGTTSDTNPVGSGVVTAVFPATGAAPDTVVSIASIPGVIVPTYGATPVTTITETAQYTGTIAWSGTPETFAPTTVYTATITLTAKDGYTFTGVTANFFTVTDATATNPANSGVVTAEFPATDDLWSDGIYPSVPDRVEPGCIRIDSENSIHVSIGAFNDVNNSINGNSLSSFQSAIVSYDPLGKYQAIQYIDGIMADIQSKNRFFIDTNNNRYIIGRTTKALNGESFAGGYTDAFIQKFDSSASLQWTRLIGTSEDDYITDIKVDSNNIAYTIGGNSSEYWVKTFDASGDILLTKSFEISSPGNSAPAFVLVDSDNFYLVGNTNSNVIEGETIPFDDPTFYSGNNAVFIMKFDIDGTLVWTKSLSAGVQLWGKGAALDNNGNVYITGNIVAGSTLLGVTVRSSAMQQYIAKISTSGTWEWANLSDLTNSLGEAIQYTNKGTILVGLTANFPGEEHGTIFVNEYNLSGELISQQYKYPNTYAAVQGMAINDEDRPFVLTLFDYNTQIFGF